MNVEYNIILYGFLKWDTPQIIQVRPNYTVDGRNPASPWMVEAL